MILLLLVMAFIGSSFMIGRIILWAFRFRSEPSNISMSNPYIIAHLGQLANDQHYDEYIEYLDKNNLAGIPFDKEITYEEYRMKKELGLN